jgi:hypothetical protein
MDFIESAFTSVENLDLKTANKLVDEITIIYQSYDALGEVYDLNKEKFTERKIKAIKLMYFLHERFT